MQNFEINKMMTASDERFEAVFPFLRGLLTLERFCGKLNITVLLCENSKKSEATL